ncbi:MAG: hypothetical protein C4339_01940 [Nitrososphaerota archaeon]
MRLRALSVLLLLSLSLLPPAWPAQAQAAPYREALYFSSVQGLSYLYRLSFQGLPASNLSAPFRSLLENLTGLRQFSLEASARPSPSAEGLVWSQLQPYAHLLGLGPLPSPGLLLRASPPSEAAALAAGLNARFNLSLAPLADGSYYSPIQYDVLVKRALWPLIPTTGLGALVRQGDFLGLPYSRILLEYSAPLGSWNITLLGFSNVALGGQFSLSSVFPALSSARVNASSGAGANITVALVGALVARAQGIEMRNDPSSLGAQGSLHLGPGGRMPNLNITITTAFPVLLATRDIDNASVKFGDVIEVRVSVRNLAPPSAPPALNLTLNEKWWRPYFDLVLGNATLAAPQLQGGGEATLAYRLRVKTNQSATLLADGGPLLYYYRAGNETLQGSVALNAFPVHVNREEGSLIMRLEPASAQPGWGPVNATLKVRNAGLRAVIGAKGNGTSLPDLLPGQSYTLRLTLNPPPFGKARLEAKEVLSWPTTSGELQASTNGISVIVDQASSQLPRPSVSLGAEGLGRPSLNLTYTLQNAQGGGAMRGYSLSAGLAPGLLAPRGNFTGLGTQLLASGNLGPGAAIRYYALINFTAPENYILPPPLLSFALGPYNFTYRGEGYGLPLGISLSQAVLPRAGFPGFNFTAIFTTMNRGTLAVYGLALVVNASGLSFLTNASLARASLAGGEAWTLKGHFRPSAPGMFSLQGTGVAFTFAGRTYTLRAPSAVNFTAYQLPVVALRAPETVPEGSSFALKVLVSNPSPLPLENISIQLVGAPSYLELSNASLLVPRLEANSSIELTLQARLTAPFDVSLPPPAAYFSYQGARLPASSSGVIIAVQEQVLLRYALPLALGLGLILLAALLVRRATFPSSPARTQERPASPHGRASAAVGA